MLDGRFDPAFALILTSEDLEEAEAMAKPMLISAGLTAVAAFAIFVVMLLKDVTP